MLREAVLVLVIAVAGCSGDDDDDTPANPTWNDDVQAILTADCGPCHGNTPATSAPDGFRLDAFDDDADDLGAFTMRCSILARAVDGFPAFMPPDGAIGATKRATIERWIEQGAVETAGGPTGTPCS